MRQHKEGGTRRPEDSSDLGLFRSIRGNGYDFKLADDMNTLFSARSDSSLVVHDAPITKLLAEWQGGDRNAVQVLAMQVYASLKHMARRTLAHDGRSMLQPTELVSEAWLRLEQGARDFQSSSHFFAVASLQMRHLLIDLGRQQAAAKRCGQPVTLTEQLPDAGSRPEDLLMVANALGRLRARDERKAAAFALVELVGFTAVEAAHLLEVSVATVERDLRFSRAWLASHL